MTTEREREAGRSRPTVGPGLPPRQVRLGSPCAIEFKRQHPTHGGLTDCDSITYTSNKPRVVCRKNKHYEQSVNTQHTGLEVCPSFRRKPTPL